MLSRSTTNAERRTSWLVRAIVLAAFALPLGTAHASEDFGVCGPFDAEGDFDQAGCEEPGIVGVDPHSAAGALHGSDVPTGTEIVPLPASISVESNGDAARESELLLALPKRADGTLPLDFVLAPGAEIADSFFSPVLCSTIARVVGDGKVSASQLVVQLPDGAQKFPHTVYQMAASELVSVSASAAAEAVASAASDEAAPAPVANPDPYREFQYGLSTVEIERAWTVSDGSGTTVAVLDSLPDPRHVDLPDFQVAITAVASNRENDATPVSDSASSETGSGAFSLRPGVHGTLMAGVIAADTGNGVGISGVAPGAQLLSVPVCGTGASEDCGLYDILRGIDVAWKNEADVVNLSLVGPSNPLLERAVSRLEGLGVLVVAAAGNEGTREPRYPAAYPSVIGVGAVDRKSELFDRSNRGLSVELLAPGVSVLSTIPGNSFAFASGTSLAAAHVSGSLAVLLGTGTTPSEARAALVGGEPSESETAPVSGSLCDSLGRLGHSCR